jgi:hypothetical protein
MIKKNLIYIILTGVVAIVLIWLSQGNRNQAPELESFIKENTENNTVSKKPVNTLNTLEGVLWSSDDEAKGNLMLVNSGITIYLKTSRDFSDLIGKNVIISMDGALDNFTLLNIEENLTKGGFIQVN